MERQLKVKDHVVYVDEHGQQNDALVTAVWSNPGNPDGCNLVFVSGDPAKHDNYGRQTEHRTSTTHKSMQPAPGNYWCWPDEVGIQ